MFTVKSPNSKKVITGLEKDIAQMVRLIANDLFKTLKRETPKRSGRARSNWRLTGRKTRYQATNDTPYINRLNTGYSNQSPKGMTRPAIREVANKQRRFK